MEKDEVREDLGGILTPPCTAVEGFGWRGELAIAVVDKDGGVAVCGQLIQRRDERAEAVAFDSGPAKLEKNRPRSEAV